METGEYIIEAETKEEAIELAGKKDLPYPTYYVDGSFEVYQDEIQEVKDGET